MEAKKRSVIAELSTGELGFLVTEVRSHLLAGVERELEPLQITAAQFVVLNSIMSGKGRTLSEFCRLLGYDSGAMTRLLDRIEAKGIIRRVENPADRRSHLVELTEQGQAVFPQARLGTEVAIRRLLSGFSENDAEALREMLKRIVANAAEG
ncbi:MarR family winged helix-turn-helix transcriptional regulator [Cupriavidus necator]|uniref:MarR family winged helix-turn-helix transcriptional regulator n=1 Tax=Cupriavidus necator TaxID=106590 RepID=UPI0005B3FA90|nr:MarR family transcriptional regulator [Cupriavidus necator]